LLEDVSDINSAVAAADRLNKQFGAPFTLAEGEMLLSASVGITLSSGSDISTPESLLREANVTMQGAKKKGKSRYTVFDPGAESTTGGRLVQESEMRQAIKDKKFRVYYQPLVSLETGAITGVEALVRWQHPLYA
jgi:predicted signal transduction protein with EAL and GGDEF domain